MPVTLQPTAMKYKARGGSFVAVDCIKGDKGNPGDEGVSISDITFNSATHTLTITLSDGSTYTTGSIQGDVGETPEFTIGTVTTVEPDQPASATITGTAEEPVLNLWIPRGESGQASNVYANNIPMSSSDPTTIATELAGKYVKPSGGIPAEDIAAGVIPSVPVTDVRIGGNSILSQGVANFTAFAAGASGLVPAPAAGDADKVLKGSGAWASVNGLPDVSGTDNGKVPMVLNGAWATQVINAFARQYWDSTNAISIEMATGKNYVAWSAGSSAGTAGAMMDATSGCIVFISNGKWAALHKGSGITITESSGTLTIGSSTNIAMGLIEV